LHRLLAVCILVFALHALGQTESGFSPNQRIDRIRSLGKTNSAQAIPALRQSLKDRDRNVRVEAVKAIVKIGTEASLDPLIEAMHDKDSEVEILATDGLVNFYVPGYVVKGGLTGPFTHGVRQVKSFFSSRNDQVIGPDVTVRQEVATAIGDVVQNGSGIDARSNAARAAGILRASGAVPALLDGLRSKDSELIFECLVALQKIKDPEAGPRVSFLARDLDPRIQMEALQTIGVLKSVESAPDVRLALTTGANEKIRRRALETLAMLGQAEDRATFKRFVNSADPRLRVAALEGLGRLREPEDYPVANHVYNEKDAGPAVHLAAAFAMVEEGNVSTAEFSPLQYLFENLNSQALGDTAQAYMTEVCRNPAVRKAVIPLATGANKDQKIRLCAALGASQSEDVVPVLTKLSSDIDPQVSLAASRALQKVKARKTSS
jgi:HEAT repeat protein